MTVAEGDWIRVLEDRVTHSQTLEHIGRVAQVTQPTQLLLANAVEHVHLQRGAIDALRCCQCRDLVDELDVMGAQCQPRLSARGRPRDHQRAAWGSSTWVAGVCGRRAVSCAGASPCSTQRSSAASQSTCQGPWPPAQWFMPGTMYRRWKSSSGPMRSRSDRW